MLSSVALIVAVAFVSASGAASSGTARPARAQHYGAVKPRRETAHSLAAAAEQPRGPEVVSKRTATSRTWRTSVGHYTTRIYAQPVNYRDSNGDWRNIDDTLGASSAAGYAYENRADSYRVAFPRSLGAKPIKIRSSHGSIGMRLVGARGHASASGAEARFANAFPGVTAAYTATPQVVKETLTLADADAPATYDYALDLGQGLSARDNGAGGIDVVDDAGRVQYSFLAPFADDKAGAHVADANEISLRLTQGGHGMRLAVDPAWLKADRKFPVTIDPGVHVADNLDCYIQNGTSANTSFCGGSTIKVGWDGTNSYRSLLKFDVAAALPAHSLVQGSHLVLNLSGQTQTAQPPIGAYRATHTWTGAATWNKFDGTNAWTTAGGDFDSTAEYTCSTPAGSPGQTDVWGLSSLTQKWLDNAVANNGILLKETTENVNNVLSFSAKAAASNQPYLGVDWTPKFMGMQKWYAMAAKRQLDDRESYAVNAANGNLVVRATDVRVAGTGMPLTVERTYNNLDPNVDEFGFSWQYNGAWDMWLDTFTDGVNYIDPTGTSFRFSKKSDGTFDAPPGINASLTHNGDGTYTVKYDKSEISYNFDADGDTLQNVKDKNGHTISTVVNAGDQPTTLTDTQSRQTSFTYGTFSAYQLVTQVTDSATRHYGYAYTNQHLTTYTDPNNKTTSYAYDGAGNMTQITDPNGNIVKFTYDTSNRVATIKEITDNTTLAGDTTTFTYNSGNTVVTDPLGHTTTYYYDSDGRQTKVTDGNGHSNQQSYNSNNDPVDYTSSNNASNGKTLHNTYDSKFNRTSVTKPGNGTIGGAQTSYSFNLTGPHPFLPDSKTNPQGNTVSFGYDSNHNLQSTSGGSPAANQISYTYDSTHPGRITSSKDGNNNVTNYGYDASGNLHTITPPAPQNAWTLNNDSLSRISSTVDGLNQTTSYTFDGIDRVTRIDYAGGSFVTYTYDGNGNITQRADSIGGTTNYTYDRKNRLTSDSGPGGSNSYTYDAANNLRTLTDGGGTVTYAYDAADNVCWAYVGSSSNGCATAPAGSTTFTYDSDNNRKTTNYPGSVTMTQTYDNADRVTEIKATKPGPTILTDFTYDYTKNNGTSTTDQDVRNSVLDASNNKTSYTYDSLGRLKQATTKTAGGGGTTVSDYLYSYDANGNITLKTGPSGQQTSFGYGADNQLCWRATGNVTGTCSTPPTGATTFTYDGNGYELSQSGRGNLAYNSHRQTTSLFGGVAQTYAGPDQRERLASGVASYKINKLGVGTRTTGGQTYYYTRDPSGGLISERTPGGTDNYLFDGLGSVAGITDSAATVQNRYSYDPYGAITSSTENVDNVWTFAQGQWGSSVQLVKFGQRYYDPSNMRWTQPDPIDETGIRKANRFLYGDDDPVDRTDPEGTNTGLDALGAGLGTAGLACGAAAVVTGGAAAAGCVAVATVGSAATGIAALADDLFG